jgi:small-conductance mechanosensitive channel
MPNATAPAAPVVLAHKPITSETLNQQVMDLVTSSQIWLHTHWLQILIASAVGVALVMALFAARRLGVKLCERDPSNAGWGTILGRAVTKTGSFFIIMTAAKLVIGYANAPQVVSTTITFLFTIAAAFQAAVWAREIILGGIQHRAGQNHEALASAFGLIRALVTFVLFAIAAIVVLDNVGVNVTGLVAGLGVGGIAIGLAAQGIFADLFAALAIIFDRPFRRGDAITYDKSSGTVESIGMKSVRIRAATGEERIISNKHLLDKEILNNTSRQYRRLQFTLGLVQWTPVDVMQRLPEMLKEVIEGCGVKYVRAGFLNFGTSSYDFDVQFDSLSPVFQDAFNARHAVGLAIIQRLNEEGIELAYPTETGFTAAPQGGMVPPYPDAAATAPVTSSSDPARRPPPPPSSGDRSSVDQDIDH